MQRRLRHHLLRLTVLGLSQGDGQARPPARAQAEAPERPGREGLAERSRGADVGMVRSLELCSTSPFGET
jgi:hypothetical protein